MKRRFLMIASTQSHIEQFHLPYCTALEELGHTVDIACPATGGRAVLPLSLKKSLFSLQNIKTVLEILDILRKKEYDTVITHTTLASFCTRVALRLRFGKKIKKIRVITVVHGYLFHEHQKKVPYALLLLAEKLLAPVTDVLITMNQWDDSLARRHRLAKEIYLLKGMGVPTVTEDSGDMSDILGMLEEGKQYLAYGGEFSKRKQQKFLIELMADLPPSVCLLLAGEGQEKEACISLVQRLGLGDRVQFLGQVPHLPTLYGQVDLVLSSSLSEGLPFHLMEAMAVGKAIIASDIKGHRDLLSQDCLFPFDPLVCMDIITQLLEDSQRLSTLGKENREVFLQNYHLDLLKPQILSLYLGEDLGKYMEGSG